MGMLLIKYTYKEPNTDTTVARKPLNRANSATIQKQV